MFDYLRKKLEETIADINPFDGGQNASTVRAARNKPAPAQTIPQNRPQAMNRPQFNTGVNSLTSMPRSLSMRQPVQIKQPDPVKKPDWIQKGLAGMGKAFTQDLPIVAEEVAKATGVVGKAIAQGAARVPETVYRSTILEPLAGNATKSADEAMSTASAKNTGLRSFLYGDDPVKSYQEQARDVQKWAGSSDNDFVRSMAPAAPFIAPAAAALDLLGLKGGMPITKKVVEKGGELASKGAEKIATRIDDITKQPGYLPEAGFAMLPSKSEDAATRIKVAQEAVNQKMQSTLTDLSPDQRIKVKEQIDNIIHETRPELFESAQFDVPQLGDASDLIPRIHTNDLKRYFGNTEELPARYKRTTGREDIDLLAQRAGYDDVDQFVEAVQGELSRRSTARQATTELASMRRSPEIISQAKQKILSENTVRPTPTTQLIPAKQATIVEASKNIPQNQGQPVRPIPSQVSAKTSSYPTESQIKLQPTTKLVPSATDVQKIQSLPSSIPELVALKQLVEEKQARVGEQFAKPRDSFQRTKGDISKNRTGTILRESKGGTQRQRLSINEDTGIREVITETRNPDGTWKTSTEREPAFEHAADHKGIEAVESNEDVNKAAAKAIQDGKEIHLYADKGLGDPNARGAAVHEFDPEKHIIDGGFVRAADTNQILGNHIKVDETGTQMSIGKKIVNMDDITGDPSKWKNVNKVTYTMDRILEKAAPSDEVYRKVRSFVIDHKQKSEAAMRIDLKAYRDEISSARKELLAMKPNTVKKGDYFTDIFHYAERKLAQEKNLADGVKLSQEDILKAKYGNDVAESIEVFDEWARKEYDSLLDRTNEVLRQFGHDEVTKRQNYMTHLQEDSLWDKIGIGEDLYRDLTSGIQGESLTNNRGSLPGNIAGLTEDFKPTKKYNPFHQARRGKDSMTDPFKAMDAYGEAAMFNIHMTESAVRARSLESVFRAAEEITNKDMLKQVNETLRASLKTSLGGQRNHLVKAFQEYANTLAGKSNHIDRKLQDDMGKGGQIALRTARILQKIAAQSSIAGNFSVTVAQSLNLPNTIGTNGVKNTVKAVGRMLSDVKFNGEPKLGSPASKSNFLKVRYTDAQSKIDRSIYQSVNDKVSKATLMPFVERAFVEFSWNTSYEQALKKGFKGNAAIKEADRITERLVAGRGIGDQPDFYRSTAARTFLQYTLEVNGALKNIRHDMGPLGIAKYAVAVFAMNYMVENITGRAPLPDMIGATLDTVKNFNDQTDSDGDGKTDESFADKVKQTSQRFAAEGTKLNPWATATVNTLGSDDAKKTLFGEESDFGRYDGTPAGAGVLNKGILAFASLINGETDKAASNAAAVVPFGSQIKKTTEGVTTMMDGVAKNSSGKVTAAVNTNDPISWVKAVLFGKNAIPEVKAFYENKGQALSEKQSDIFTEMENSGEDASSYAKSIMSERDDAVANKRAPSAGEAEATAKVNLAKGTWKKQDGLIVDKNGDVQREYYKDLASSRSDKSNETYDAYVKGYNLDPSPSKVKKGGSTAKTGNEMYDALLAKEDTEVKTKSKASTAVNLFTNDKKYENVPDWVKDRFYKESGFKKEDVQYAALARVDKDTKVASYYKPLFEKEGHDALYNELYAGRTKSIYDNYIMAQDSILTQLRDEGLITAAEAKYLKSIKLERDGKETASSTKVAAASRSKGGGKAKGKGSKSGKKGKFDYKLFGFSAAGKSNSGQLRDLLKKAQMKVK